MRNPLLHLKQHHPQLPPLTQTTLRTTQHLLYWVRDTPRGCSSGANNGAPQSKQQGGCLVQLLLTQWPGSMDAMRPFRRMDSTYDSAFS
jgi:hypothetical protein